MQHKCFKTIKVTVANDSADDVHDDCDDNDDHDDHETRFDKSKSESKVFALMHGLFCGPIPMELDCLNYIELSLVSQINVITRVNVHTKYIHSTMKSFSVLNTVHDVVKQLPNTKVLESLAYVRSANASNSSFYAYRPFCVLRALRWLVSNNPFYADIEIIVDAKWNDATETDYVSDGIHTDIVNTDDEPDLSKVMENEVTNENNDGVRICENEFVMPEQPPEAPDKIMTRQKNSSVRRYNDRDWAYKAFPKLFPYGRGFSHQIPVRNYVSYTLQLGGDRRFQASSQWIFYFYYDIISNRLSYISATIGAKTDARNALRHGELPEAATRESHGTVTDATVPCSQQSALTVKSMSQLIESLERGNTQSHGISNDDIKRLMSTLRPYCKAVPGTPMFIQNQRRNILSLISWPLVRQHGVFTWFNTLSPVDSVSPILFTQYISTTYKKSWEESKVIAMGLSDKQRETILRRHPALASRIFVLKSEAFFECIVNGESKPLGNVKDYFRRTEFQRGGSPHVHGMYSIDDGPSASALHGNQIDQDHVKRMVNLVLTASLYQTDGNDVVHPHEHTEAIGAVAIDNDPRRVHFEPPSATLDYSYDTEDHTPDDVKVRQMYKTLQLTSNGGFFHQCMHTCWKYNKKKDKTCRFGYCRPLFNDVVVSEVCQPGKKRIRTRVEPVRNNGHLNPSHRSPLFTLGHGANHDLQFCADERGAAEYM